MGHPIKHSMLVQANLSKLSLGVLVTFGDIKWKVLHPVTLLQHYFFIFGKGVSFFHEVKQFPIESWIIIFKMLQ